MEDEFVLPVTFKGKEWEFPARLLHYGYSVKLEVDMEGTKILFEPDEERNWRAVIPYEELEKYKKIKTELLKAVSEVIGELLQ
jgi:hypothetical protein